VIRLDDRELPAATAGQLVSWQAELDAISDHDQRVESAIKAYNQRSHTAVFRDVRETLASMCSGLERCGYCEDGAAHQVEHIWPKSWYPERTFMWRNFLFSCGLCNERKNAKFALIRGDALHTLVRRRGEPRTPPPLGAAAIIDPRREDPLDYFQIDLGGTFFVWPRTGLGDVPRLRAVYTIDVLGLNKRNVLVVGRRDACRDYAFRTHEYTSLDPDAPETLRRHRLDEIARLRHRMVWEEMKRSPELVEGLRAQLDAAPELRMV
jgi:uncharacterized protein (TIGR02646 family)